jgi:hypothetical protein
MAGFLPETDLRSLMADESAIAPHQPTDALHLKQDRQPLCRPDRRTTVAGWTR